MPYRSWSPILCNCPYLQDVHLDTLQEDDTDTLVALEACPQLVGIYFCKHRTLDIPTAVSRFNGLQRLRLPDFLGPESFPPIISHLVRSSLCSLQLLDVTSIPTQDFLQILETFPNLQEVVVHRSGITVQDLTESPTWACSQNIEIFKINGICDRHWDRKPPIRCNFWPTSRISDWTLRHHAQDYVIALSRLFTSLRKSNPRLATIQLNCQYEIHKLFFSEEEALMYANKFGEGAVDRIPMTIKDLQSMGVKVQLRAESSDDENSRFTEHDSDQEYTMAKARNRHCSLHDRKQSQFRRPLKK